MVHSEPRTSRKNGNRVAGRDSAAVGCRRLAFTVLFCLFLCDLTEAEEISSRALRIHIPRGISPERVSISYGIYRKGLLVGELRGKAGTQDYQVRLAEGCRIKMLAFCPGYRAATMEAESAVAALEPWVPQFEKVPMVRLKGRLVDSNGTPLPNENLVVTYDLIELMGFLGYIDGGVPDVRIAAASTDKDGAFSVQVPWLLDDPFFAKYKSWRSHFSLAVIREGMRFPTWDLVPCKIPVRRKYEPLSIKLINHATLKGRIGAGFRERSQIEGEIGSMLWAEGDRSYRIDLSAVTEDGKAAYNCFLEKDRTFRRSLPPGTYDLYLRVMKRGAILHRKVLVEADMTLKEAEEKIITAR